MRGLGNREVEVGPGDDYYRALTRVPRDASKVRLPSDALMRKRTFTVTLGEWLAAQP